MYHDRHTHICIQPCQSNTKHHGSITINGGIQLTVTTTLVIYDQYMTAH